MKYLPILMTASVSTRGMQGACFSDEERYGMYLGALKYYVEKFFINKNAGSNIRLVFADNSGWDLSSFSNALAAMFGKDTVDSNIEFVSLPPELFDITQGKGYNELLMINHAVDRSEFIKEAGAFFKVTGRYPIYNLERFHKASACVFEKGYQFYCDIKDHNLYRRLGLDWNSHSFEARLWGSTVGFYNLHIRKEYTNCYDYDGRHVECVLHDKLSKLTDGFKNCKDAGISIRFSREARFGGIEGSSSTAASFSKDQQSLKSRLKIAAGNFFRIFMPWFKF